jgi:hypothetical protein
MSRTTSPNHARQGAPLSPPTRKEAELRRAVIE